MQVFHGSYTEIHEIDLTKCQANKDFGRGFYVTKFANESTEKEWQKIYELLKQELNKSD